MLAKYRGYIKTPCRFSIFRVKPSGKCGFKTPSNLIFLEELGKFQDQQSYLGLIRNRIKLIEMEKGRKLIERVLISEVQGRYQVAVILKDCDYHQDLVQALQDLNPVPIAEFVKNN